MTKDQAKELQEKYGMQIMRHYITNEGGGLYVDTPDLIPELDALADADLGPRMACRRSLFIDTYRYELILPKSWFDLWGWA